MSKKGTKHQPALASSCSSCPHCAGLGEHADTPGARKACKEAVARSPAFRAQVDAHKKKRARLARSVTETAR